MNPERGLHKYGFQSLVSLQTAISTYFPRFSLLPAEDVPLDEASNRIVAEVIVAPINLPPFSRSAMDGYAILASDSFHASTSKPRILDVIEVIKIGEFPKKEVAEGQAMEIATGAPIPHGADAVIPVEDTKAEGSCIKIFMPVHPQQNVIAEGEDIHVGSVVLQKGDELRPDHLGLLRSLGIEKIKCAKQPRAVMLSTGDELVSPGMALPPGKIYDSNNVMNHALLSRYGGHIIAQKVLPDDPAIIKQEIAAGVEAADVVVCSGGTSVGTKDFLPQIVQELGEIVVHGVAQKPGSPILLGSIKNKPIICLPGFPVANYVGIITILGPFLRYLQGALRQDLRMVVFGRLAKNVSIKGLGRINYMRVTLKETDSGYVVLPKKLAGSGILRSLTESDGMVEIPADTEGFEEGEIVKVYLHLR